MLHKVARQAVATPRLIILLALLLMIIAAVIAAPISKVLGAGGYLDPSSETSEAARVLAKTFDQGDMELIFTLSSDDGALGKAARERGTEIVERLRRSPHVATVTSTWTVRPEAQTPLISKDGKTGLIIAGIRGDEDDAPRRAAELSEDVIGKSDDVTVRAGGLATVYTQINSQSMRDLLLMEAIALPLILAVLVWVFGGLVAAALPMLVSCFAIVGSVAVLRVIAMFTDVHIFALNLTVALGVALAIDYTLLIVSRFREEVSEDGDRQQALLRTVITAGRTVLFSALIVGASMATMALFPIYLLESFAYAGIATVTFAAVAAVVVAPAALIILGDRIESLDARRFLRHKLRRAETMTPPAEHRFWYLCAKWVMRRAVPVAVVLTAVLLIVGAPFLGVRWGFPDDRALPASASAHQVGDQLRNDFAYNSADLISVVLPDMTGVTADDLSQYAAALSRVSDVASVSAPTGTFVGGSAVGRPAGPTGTSGDSAFLTVATTAPLLSAASERQLHQLRMVTTPAGQRALMTGLAPVVIEGVNSITSRMPVVFGVIAVITFVVLFVVTGSVVLPVVGLILNVLALCAAFGALVWIFQNGGLYAMGITSTGTLVVSVPVLLFCVAFGLSIDYQVFLVARIREYWLQSSMTATDCDEVVALGIARTGRVITAAALLMSISFGALIVSQVSFMRMYAFGLTLAVLVDATLIRMFLYPAVMHMLGRASWWAPKSLQRLHGKPDADSAAAYGRHAALDGGHGESRSVTAPTRSE